MKQYWLKLSSRIDALTLRERVIVFALAVVVLITLVNQALLDPLFREQKRLSQQIQQDQQKIAALRTQIQANLQIQAIDPDALNRETLRKLTEQMKQMQAELKEMQKGLVSPDKMPELLESILRQNGRLRLVALKTLPSQSLTDAGKAEGSAPNSQGVASGVPAESKDKTAVPIAPVYKHGVEVVVQGGYLDMLAYMAALERLPWQLFWAKAKLDSVEYSKATLTLTLYTLSLDKKWLNI